MPQPASKRRVLKPPLTLVTQLVGATFSPERSTETIDAIRRALALLRALLGYAEKFIDQGALGAFRKGKLVAAELTDSLTAGKYLITTIENKTFATARLVLVNGRCG
jgi:hypothetical protein